MATLGQQMMESTMGWQVVGDQVLANRAIAQAEAERKREAKAKDQKQDQAKREKEKATNRHRALAEEKRSSK